ncbi:MAG: hypothetical protein IKQ17_07005 [Kiritimatiellae bacterium]|nr:hypothetical protein [Kiritimatiellia bacterium]
MRIQKMSNAVGSYGERGAAGAAGAFASLVLALGFASLVLGAFAPSALVLALGFASHPSSDR